MIESWYLRSQKFLDDAHRLLSHHEASRKSRTITIEQTYSKLSKLSAKQDDLLRQSLRCVEHELYRAAHVMAWSAFMDFIEQKLGADGYAKVRAIRGDNSIKSVDELRDNCPDFQIIECLRKTGLVSKTEEKALKGLLNKRNECAHPSEYYPDLNESLGYISEIIRRTETLKKRKMK